MAKIKTVRIYSGFLDGIVSVLSTIEITVSPGIPSFDIIGLCDSSIRESRGRINSAIRSNGYNMPKGHITVSISPAYMHKSGSNMDLAILMGLLIISGQLNVPENSKIYAEGEISLLGDIRRTPGCALRLRLAAGDPQFTHIFIPEEESIPAGIVGIRGVTLNNINDLQESISRYSEYERQMPFMMDKNEGAAEKSYLTSLKGQEKTKRAILIAACGFHNIFLLGSPGSGKTMAGKMIKDLLPPLSSSEIGDVYALKEHNGEDSKITDERPFRFITRNMSISNLFGRSISLKSGEMALANHGILFMDEVPEFRSGVIDALREPLETHLVKLIKDGKTYSYPARFLFIGTGNPCRCGNYLEPDRKCICSLSNRVKYLSKVSGPFLDRIDIYSEMRTIGNEDFFEMVSEKGITAEDKAIQIHYEDTVRRVWDIQKERYGAEGRFNGTETDLIADELRIDDKCAQYAAELADKIGFTGRGYSKLIRVGRTIADIEGAKDINKDHINEAAVYRTRRLTYE